MLCELNKFKEYRKNGKNIRDAIRPFLELVNISSEAIAEGIAGVSIASVQIAETCLILMISGGSTSESGICRYSGIAQGMCAVTHSRMNLNPVIELGCK